MAEAAGLARRFSRAAAVYESRSVVQRRVARDLLSWLPAPLPDSVLEVGCGTGQLTAGLVGARRVVAIDIAPAMVARCAARAPGAEVREADFLGFEPDGRFDLVVSSSSLHWMRPFEAVAAQLARCGRRFVVALMVEGTLAELHEARERIAPGKAPPPLPSLRAAVRALREAGAVGIELGLRHHESAYENGLALMRDLNECGLTGAGGARLSRMELAALAQALPSPMVARYRVAMLRGELVS